MLAALLFPLLEERDELRGAVLRSSGLQQSDVAKIVLNPGSSMSSGAQQLPGGWHTQVSTTSGETYYVNSETLDSQYEFPTGPTSEYVAKSPSATSSGSTLPAGWTTQVSRSSGDTYYVNQVTGDSQFEVPTAPAGTKKQPAALPCATREEEEPTPPAIVVNPSRLEWDGLSRLCLSFLPASLSLFVSLFFSLSLVFSVFFCLLLCSHRSALVGSTLPMLLTGLYSTVAVKLYERQSQKLTLSNLSPDRDACYTIKTTCVARYAVLPGQGLIPAGATAEVEIVLIKMDELPGKNDLRDRFLIQAAWKDDPAEEVQAFWKRGPKKDELYEKKFSSELFLPDETEEQKAEERQELAAEMLEESVQEVETAAASADADAAKYDTNNDGVLDEAEKAADKCKAEVDGVKSSSLPSLEELLALGRGEEQNAMIMKALSPESIATLSPEDAAVASVLAKLGPEKLGGLVEAAAAVQSGKLPPAPAVGTMFIVAKDLPPQLIMQIAGDYHRVVTTLLSHMDEAKVVKIAEAVTQIMNVDEGNDLTTVDPMAVDPMAVAALYAHLKALPSTVKNMLVETLPPGMERDIAARFLNMGAGMDEAQVAAIVAELQAIFSTKAAGVSEEFTRSEMVFSKLETLCPGIVSATFATVVAGGFPARLPARLPACE